MEVLTRMICEQDDYEDALRVEINYNEVLQYQRR